MRGGQRIASESDIDTIRQGHGFPIGGVFTAALDAVIVMDGDGLVQDWNPAATELFGFSWNEAVGQELADLVIPPNYRAAHRAAFQRYVASRVPTILDKRLQLTALHQDGREFPIELTVTQVPDVEPPLFAGFLRHLASPAVSAQETERLQQRLAFLAHAGLTLDVSLDLEETMRRLVGLTVPELAELAVIDLIEPEGAIQAAVAAAGNDPDSAAALEQMRRDHPLDATSRHPVAEVLRTGQSALLPAMSLDQLRGFAQSDDHYELMTRLRYSSAIVVPLAARGRTLGALSLLRMHDDTPYDRQDLLLAETLARRAALTLENARLYAATRHIAQTLQQSLLPRALPEISGAHLAARYRAAAEGQDVGGDFYDAFQIGENCWGIAIGDVCGKGPEAAALTALARYTIRAVSGNGPERVLSLLNDAVLREGSERFLTALFAEMRSDGDDLVLEIAVGGHPPPFVVRADGSVEMVPAHGALIGVIPGLAYEKVTVTLKPGEKLVLYTDGLTDARAPDVVLTEDDLMQLLSDSNGLEGQELAEFLESRATADAEARDDIAILVLEAVGEGATGLSVHYYATSS